MELLQLGCKAWETLMQSNAILPSAGRCNRWAKRNPVRLGINQEPETSNLLIGMICKWWFLQNDSRQFHGKWSTCWIALLNFMHCNSSSVVRSSSWGSLGWRWQVDDEVDVVMLRDQLRERHPESRGKGPMNDETGINRVRVRPGENLSRFEHLQHLALDLRCNSRFQVRIGKNMFSDSSKKDDLWRFTRSFHSPPLMSNETHQWFMRIQPMYPPQSDLHTK